MSCAKCGAHYEARITSLSDPIDVYSDWIDACEAANREAEPGAAPGDAARGGGGGGAVQRAAPADQDDDDE